MVRPNLTRIVESVFDLERDTTPWMSGILGHLEPWLGEGLGAFGFTYSVSEDDRLVPESFTTLGCSPAMTDELPLAVTLVAPEVVREGYLGFDHATSSEVPGWSTSVAAELAREAGVAEIWSLNGRHGGNRGCALFVNRQSGRTLFPAERRLLARIAEQVAAAERLRARLRLANAIEWTEAIVGPGGKVHHAVGDATSKRSLDLLRSEALALERAGCKERKSKPPSRRGAWKGLIAGRWTLLEHFSNDGRRYILAHENKPEPPSILALSRREREVLASAVLGHSNKEIAHALGIAHSTVRVLLMRAAGRLGARSRMDLLRRFEAFGAVECAATRPPREDALR